MSVDIGRDTRLRVPGPILDCVDWRASVQQERERGMPQIMEANVRQVGLFEYAFELAGHLGLVDEGANAGREDHAVFFPALTRQDLLSLLSLALQFQHGQ